MGKILVIGLDGATFDLIGPWIKEGKLPNLRSMQDDGTMSTLNSTPFPSSGPAWVSSVTGVNPGKHGIFGFGLRDKQSNYRLQLANSTSIEAKTLPLLLTEYGKFSGLMNMPLSYPPYKINGSIISGMLTPTEAETYTFPPGLQHELLKAIPDYVTEVSPFDFDLNNTEGKVLYVEELLKSIRVRTSAAKLLMDQSNWDFFMVVFSELDRIQHKFWAEMDESHRFNKEKDKSLSSTIIDAYQELDKAIGILIDDLPPETQILIISDHGFGACEEIFYLNRFLEERGFLKLKKGKYFQIPKALKDIAKRIPGTRKLYKRLKSEQELELCKHRRDSDPRNESKKIMQWVSDEMIDWSRSRAFADQYGLRINMKGREPEGIVDQKLEANKLIDDLIGELNQLKFPHNNKLVFTDIKLSRAVYHGPFVERAPDLITYMDVGEPHPAYNVKTLFGDSFSTTGAHKKEGIFIAWGKGIKNGECLESANIADITPTICYTLGIPLTPEMDGKVLDIFEGGLDSCKIDERGGTSMRKERAQEIYRVDQESEIKKRLKDLGYID